MLELIDALQWRYATKKYSNKKVPKAVLDRIIKAVNLSASSLGLQPYRLYVIDNDQLRKELATGSFNPQVTEASHLLVFAAFDAIDELKIDTYLALIATKRKLTREALEPFKKKALAGLLAMTGAEFLSWATKQAYIALGTALIAAAMEKVDATPMEGFGAAHFDGLLDLKEKGMRSVVLMALGYRDDENDPIVELPKVRWPQDEFVTYIK
jgi:nitroreductase / dihydropteridine reductase